MAMDNPSYFAVPKAERFQNFGSNPFRHRGQGTADRLSPLSPPPPLMTTSLTGSLGGGSSPQRPTTLPTLPTDPRQHPALCDRKGRSSDGSGDDYLVPNAAIATSPRTDPSKRSFRSLLRSLSANAATNDTDSILLGEPRPTDIAPPNHSAPFSMRSNRRFTHSRNTSLRSCAEIRVSEFQHALMRRRAQECGGNDEAFHTMPLPGNRRRHSIGAYLSRDKISTKGMLKVTSVPSEVPKMNAPKVPPDGSAACAPPGEPSRRHAVTTLHRTEPPLPVATVPAGTEPKKKRPRGLSMKELETIMVVSCKESPEAELWADYLTSCFNKIISQRAKQHYKVVSISIEEITEFVEESPKLKQVSNAKLQLLILCPKLLQHVADLSDKALDILKVFQTDKVLTMLLGVSDESISDPHRRAFPGYDNWQRMTVKVQDNTFVDNFLGTAVDILSKKFRSPVEKTNFSIIPKKIKPGQNRVIALLNEPITNDDVITVRVDKKGELLQIHSFKKRNPYTLQFDVPDCCLEVSMLVWIKIEKNGVSCGSRQIKCESRLRELDQILRASENPLEFMCQTLGFKTTDRDQLDNWMLTAFQRNIPPHFNLLSTPLQANVKVNSPSVEEYPTLLHFAARFGLERLSWQLLECPGGEAACDLRNLRHLTPADLALAHGHPHLAATLRGFMQMNEFSNMYYYLKNMSEESPEASNAPGNQKKIMNTENPTGSWDKCSSSKSGITPINTPDGDRSDPFSEECLQNLESKNFIRKILKTPESPRLPLTPKLSTGEWFYENDMQNMTTSFNSASSPNNIQKAIEHDYLIQPSNRKVENDETTSPNRPKMINLNFPNKINSNLSSPNTEKLPPFTLPQDFFECKGNFKNLSIPKSKNSGSLSVSSKSSQDHHVTTPTGQDELAEIINDFKNNVFTIVEVENLVSDWRNRNETPQSLKEKQEQLNRMREEYDKLQLRIKDDMKRPTPFERVKKIFSKGKSKNVKNTMTDAQKLNGQRPNSGLSIHSVSSSSSGRLSTASGGSLGDSGTQSDNEDAKMFNEMISMHKVRNDRMHESYSLDDYLIPPPPRPFTNNLAGPHTSHLHTFQGKNQPLPSIPGTCHSKQEYMIKTPQPMDTISEKEVPVQLQDLALNSLSSGSLGTRFSADAAEHQYMNMSPALLPA